MLDSLPEDDIPKTIPILYEDREKTGPPPGEHAISTQALGAWLEAGDENSVDFPIAKAAFDAASLAFTLPLDLGVLASRIQGIASDLPRREMIRISDVAEFMIASGASASLPGYDGGYISGGTCLLSTSRSFH